MKVRAFSLGVAALALTACASPQWKHAHLVGADADLQFLVADGQCISASSAVPIPEAPTQPHGYTVEGRAHTTSGTAFANTQYTAEVRPTHSTAQAMQSVQAAGERGAALGSQRRVYIGCMAEKGWYQTQP